MGGLGRWTDLLLWFSLIPLSLKKILHFYFFLLGSLQTSLFLTPTQRSPVRWGSGIRAPAVGNGIRAPAVGNGIRAPAVAQLSDPVLCVPTGMQEEPKSALC